MLPAYFGSTERALFGLCVPAAGERRHRGALVCPPLLDEYFWAQRTCRLLADRLVKQGIDVLRFDYFGSGDSGGASSETRLEGAVEDTVTALQELRDLTQVRRTTLIGMRLGAVIAARASLHSKDVDRLVLWDPVADGRLFSSSLKARAHRSTQAEQVLDLSGLPLPAPLMREIEAIDVSSFEPSATEVLLVVSEDRPEHRRLQSEMKAKGVEVSFSLMQNAPFWSERDALGYSPVPFDAVDHVAGWSS